MAAWCALAAGAVACNGLSGVGDLKEVDTLDAGHLPDATVTPPDAAPDAATATDAQVPRPDGAELDAADAACAPLPAPLFLGAARALQGAYEITTPVVGIGGAVVWPLPQALDHFDASFEFVIGTSSGVTPAAGLVFFLSSAAGKGLGLSSLSALLLRCSDGSVDHLRINLIKVF